jgi:hypothetical protein
MEPPLGRRGPMLENFSPTWDPHLPGRILGSVPCSNKDWLKIMYTWIGINRLQAEFGMYEKEFSKNVEKGIKYINTHQNELDYDQLQ